MYASGCHGDITRMVHADRRCESFSAGTEVGKQFEALETLHLAILHKRWKNQWPSPKRAELGAASVAGSLVS